MDRSRAVSTGKRLRGAPASAGRAGGGGSGPRAGFSLLELMIVVVIVMAVAALAAPAISNALEQRRASEAALDVVRIAREARSLSASRGWAHLLRFTNAEGGQFTLYRGQNDGCRTTNWGAVVGDGCADNPDCIDSLLMSADRYEERGVTVVTDSVGATVDVCYEASGIMYVRAPIGGGPDAFSAQNNIGGGVLFRVIPAEGAPERLAVLPLGGDPRIVR